MKVLEGCSKNVPELYCLNTYFLEAFFLLWLAVFYLWGLGM